MKQFWIFNFGFSIESRKDKPPSGFNFGPLSGNRKSKNPKPKLVGVIAIVVTLAIGGAIATAQQPAKTSRIGLLVAVSQAAVSDRTEAFRRGLRDLGYIEGKNIIIESRYADGKLERLPALAAELMRLNVKVIITAGPPATRAANDTVSGIPIVMAQDSDPVGNGFVVSLARPGGSITGLSTVSSELNGKRMELLKETVAKLFRVAVIGNSTIRGNAQALEEIRAAAEIFRVQVQYVDVRNPADIDNAFRDARKGRVHAILLTNNPILSGQRRRVADLAQESRLPAIFERFEYVQDGGLMSYGVSSTDLYRRAATYVDRILKGAKPADLPVEQPTKFELVINLKTAKQIGLTIPPNVLARADKVIR